MYMQGIIQPGRDGGLRISLPRLDVLKTQMGKDVLFSLSFQELFLERGQTNRKSVTRFRKYSWQASLNQNRNQPRIIHAGKFVLVTLVQIY